MTALATEPVAETFEQRKKRLEPESLRARAARLQAPVKRFDDKMMYPRSPEGIYSPLAKDIKRYLHPELVKAVGTMPGSLRGAFYDRASHMILGYQEGDDVRLEQESILPKDKQARLAATRTHRGDIIADEVLGTGRVGAYEEMLRPYMRALAQYVRRVDEAERDADYEAAVSAGRAHRARVRAAIARNKRQRLVLEERKRLDPLLKPMAAAGGFVDVLRVGLVGLGAERLRDPGPRGEKEALMREALAPEVAARVTGGVLGVAATLKVAPGAAGRILTGAALGRGEAIEAGEPPTAGAIVGAATFTAFEVGRFAVGRFRNVRALGKRLKIPYSDAKNVYAASQAGDAARAGQALHDAYMREMVPRIDQKAARAIKKALDAGRKLQATRIYQRARAKGELKGLYAQLGVKADVTPDELEMAFQQVARAKLTPSEAMKARSAYEVLRNPALRAKYDAGRMMPSDWQLRVAPTARPAGLPRPALTAEGRPLLAKVAEPREAVPAALAKPAPAAKPLVTPAPTPAAPEGKAAPKPTYQPSGLAPDATLFNTPRENFEGYAWRLMSRAEYEKVAAGQKTYGGTRAKRGQYLAPTPQSAAQYKAKGKVLVEFAGVEKAEGETVSNLIGQANVTSAKEWTGTEWKAVSAKPTPAPKVAKAAPAKPAKMTRAEVLAQLKERGIYHKKLWKKTWLVEALEGKRQPITAEAVPNKGIRNLISDESGTLDIEKAGEALGKVQRGILRVVEPAKIVERKFGPKVYSDVIVAMHLPDRVGVWWDTHRLADAGDQTLGAIHEQLQRFSAADLENLMLARGNPGTAEGQGLKRDALRALPQDLRPYLQTLQNAADLNYHLATRVDPDLKYVEDYFYGVYKDGAKAMRFLDHYKTTERWRKHKTFPTYADARAAGLKLRDPNPIDNLRREAQHIARLAGLMQLRGNLIKGGLGRYVVLKENATLDQRANWGEVKDPTFKDLLVDADLARLINNLIEVNKVSRSRALRALRNLNNTLRSIKFIGSAFHLGVVAKQGLADVGPMGVFMPGRVVHAAREIWSLGFRGRDAIFATREYQEYIGLGGGHKFSMSSQAQRAMDSWLTSKDMNILWRTLRLPGRIGTAVPRGFIRWLFNSYIPKLKYAKYIDEVERAGRKLGRPLVDAEKINIIKEGQNFYGMMNERLFGRSATMTSLLRFFFMSPGYAEGNYRTMAKAGLQWRKGGPVSGARRSRWNIPQSLFLTGLLATVGTLIMTGKLPDPPENLEGFRDLFKVKTDWKDERDRTIYVDLLTYDKDYWEQAVVPGWKIVTGHPIEAAELGLTKFVKRIGGMKAGSLGLAADLYKLSTGEALVDWKGQRIFYMTDPALIKLQKLGIHALDRLQPISISVARRMMDRDVHPIFAFTAAAMGIRPAYSERDKQVNVLMRSVWSLRENQEELYYRLSELNSPRQAIKDYNAIVDRITAHPLMTEKLSEDLHLKKRPLRIDVDRLIENKVYAFTHPGRETDKQKRDIRWLKNFGISREQAKDLVAAHFRRRPLKQPTTWSIRMKRLKTIRDRQRRIDTRWAEESEK